MPAIRVTTFSGMIPAIEDKLLPNGNAAYAMNCRLDNGKLRAFRVPVSTNDVHVGDIAYDQKDDFVFSGPIDSKHPTLFRLLTQNFHNYNTGATPYNLYPRVFGLAGNVVRGIDLGSTRTRSLGVPPGPTVIFNGIQGTPGTRSEFYAPRAYCATYVNSFGEESAPGAPSVDIQCYEGDVILLRILPSFTPGVPDTFDVRKIRLYRTLAEFETGEQMGNKNNTEFHLVREFNYVTNEFPFNDNITSDMMPADLLLSREFFIPPQLDAVGMVELELGFLAIAYRDGTIRLSERFQYHAFPIRNQITIPQVIDNIVAYYNTIFVTCKSGACYQVQVSLDASGVKFDPQYYPDLYWSTAPQTLVRTNYGALFSSQKGLMALNKGAQTLVTQNLILPQQWKSSFAPQYGAWIPGFYLGLNTLTGKSWLMDVPDDISGGNQFGILTYVDKRLIKVDPYGSTRFSMVYGKDKLYIAIGNVTYTWDGLEIEQEYNEERVPYLWRSKLYVEAAPTSFAAAKVVMKSDFQQSNTPITFRFFGDGVLRLQRTINRGIPFRLPSLYKATTFYFELEGIDQIDEVHIAASMDELSGEPK